MSDGYGRSAASPITSDQAVRLIVRTCLEEGITDERQIAYVLATAEHESQNFTKPEEDYGRQQATRLGYEGGEDFFGRGYAHLTHRDNYRRLGEALGRGDDFVNNPALAADPEVASRVLVVGMRDGLFTSRGLGDYINADGVDYENARRIVNGIDRQDDIADLARNWEGRVADLVTEVQRDGVDLTPIAATRDADAPLQRGDANARAFELQQYLAELGVTNDAGRAISPDGDFGPSTEQAVRTYQRNNGIDPATGTVDAALFDRIRGDVQQANPDFALKTFTELHGPLNDNVLSRDERGDPVADIQRQLRGLGYTGADGQPLEVNRRYTAGTEAAVRQFQRDENIEPADGRADERTRDALNARAVEQGLPEAAEAVRRREAAEAAQVPVPAGAEPPAEQPAGRGIEQPVQPDAGRRAARVCEPVSGGAGPGAQRRARTRHPGRSAQPESGRGADRRQPARRHLAGPGGIEPRRFARARGGNQPHRRRSGDQPQYRSGGDGGGHCRAGAPECRGGRARGGRARGHAARRDPDADPEHRHAHGVAGLRGHDAVRAGGAAPVGTHSGRPISRAARPRSRRRRSCASSSSLRRRAWRRPGRGRYSLR